jgi:hypothetical protein
LKRINLTSLFVIFHNFKTLISAGAIIVFTSCLAQAQETAKTTVADTLYRVEMNDGNVFVGEIVDQDNEKVILKSDALGQITLHRRFIVKIEQIINPILRMGDLWYRHLQSSRYFFAPNGYGLKKGESYYQNIWIFYNQYTVGLSDRFSIGFGTMPLFLFNFSPTPIWITPKFSIPLAEEKVNLGVGALIGDVIGDNTGLFGITYGTVTFGPHDKNFSIGIGYAFAGDEFLSTPLINIGGLLRVGRKTYLMTENYIISAGGETAGFSIIGGRSMINKSAIDYGLGLPIAPGMDVFLAIPWLGITIPFSKNN